MQPYGGGPAVPAVAFATPEGRCIADGLPPPQRLARQGNCMLLQQPAGPSPSPPAAATWPSASAEAAAAPFACLPARLGPAGTWSCCRKGPATGSWTLHTCSG